MAAGRRHRRHMDLPQVYPRDFAIRARLWQRLPCVDRQAQFIVVCPPGQLHPTQMGLAVLLCQRQQQGWTLPSHGQAQLARGQDGERLILPDHRLVDFGMVGVVRLDAATLGQLLPAEFRGGVHVGDELLAERLHALAVQRILPASGRLLQRASAPVRGHGRGASPRQSTVAPLRAGAPDTGPASPRRDQAGRGGRRRGRRRGWWSACRACQRLLLH
jgi:hypothetical protein